MTTQNNPADAVREALSPIDAAVLLADLRSMGRDGWIAADAAADHIAALTARVAASERDAARYRRMRAGPDLPAGEPCAYRFEPGDQEHLTPIGGDKLDAALDAAMEKNP